eukprot:PITA_33365
MGWKIHQMDVNIAFLNGQIEEEVYIKELEGFETFDHESHVCRLKRVLYGAKTSTSCLVHQDRQLLHQLIMSCKEDLAREFKMKDMGLMHYFLGMEVWQKDGELFVSQGMYANEILKRFHMEKCKPMQTPLASNWRKEVATSKKVVETTVYLHLVGSLMYLVNTRTDLCYGVNQLSQAMVQPTKMFWKVEKHVLRYLRGTCQYGLWYRWTEGVKLQGFTDAHWAGSPSN